MICLAAAATAAGLGRRARVFAGKLTRHKAIIRENDRPTTGLCAGSGKAIMSRARWTRAYETAANYITPLR